MALDRQKTEMQETGSTFVGGMALSSVMEIITEIGIEPSDAYISDGFLRSMKPKVTLREFLDAVEPTIRGGS